MIKLRYGFVISALTFVLACFCSSALYAEDLPEFFDWRLNDPYERNSGLAGDAGVLSPIKDQGFYGTCWAFAELGALEANIKFQLQKAGINAESMDLSERYFAWLAYAKPTAYKGDFDYFYSALDYPDSGYNKAQVIYNQGGYYYTAVSLFGRGLGLALESDAPYSPYKIMGGIENFLKPAAFVKNIYSPDPLYGTEVLNDNYDAEKIAEYVRKVKELLMINPVAMCEFDCNFGNFDDSFMNYYLSDISVIEGEHAVQLVGWDDDYDFSETSLAVKPTEKGAWILKNSWSEGVGEDGYLYLSYQDKGFGTIWFYEAEMDVSRYTSIDRHDSFGYIANYNENNSITPQEYTIGSIYQADKSKFLKAVSMNVLYDDMAFELKIFKNASNAEDGELVYTQSGKFGENGLAKWAGLRTVDLDSFVYLKPDEKYFVTIEFTREGVDPQLEIPICANDINKFVTEYTIEPGSSFLWNEETEKWQDITDLASNTSLCMQCCQISHG